MNVNQVEIAEWMRARARTQIAPRPRRVDERPPIDDFAEFHAKVFPGKFAGGYATYHAEFWRHVFGLRAGESAPAFVAIWPRGFGKSTSVEYAAAVVGAIGSRSYVLYVSATQDQADDHVGNVAKILESASFERYFPNVSRRQVGKYGTATSWRRNRLVTDSGFTVDAIGLDTASRGAKMGDIRPDLIICDDIDGLSDTAATTKKKIAALTKTVIPAGGPGAAVIVCQNLIHQNSIVSRLAGVSPSKADFLLDRFVSGPHPAVEGLEIDESGDEPTITAGRSTWAGMSIAALQTKLRASGVSAFLAELQQEVRERGGSMFAHVTFRRVDRDKVPTLERAECWVDPAVTDTAMSDAQGIQIDGYAAGITYRLYSWERRASPDEAIRHAILKAREFQCTRLGVETDQGGDTWKTVYRAVWDDLVRTGKIPADEKRIEFADEKAGAGYGPKAHRTAEMLSAYERGEIVHVRGTHHTLEAALVRYLVEKPYDLVDAAFWSWRGVARRRKVARVR
jgi:hypothetical protein